MISIIHASHRHSYCWGVAQAINNTLVDTGAIVKLFDLAELHIEMCCGTQKCQTEECIYNDDFTKLMYHHLLNSEVTYIVTPTYFDMPPARLKSMIDRANAILPHIDEKMKRYFGVWVCGETEISSLDSNIKSLTTFAEICGMCPVDELMVKVILESESQDAKGSDGYADPKVIAEVIKSLV